jgi:hypothetical protein
MLLSLCFGGAALNALPHMRADGCERRRAVPFRGNLGEED